MSIKISCEYLGDLQVRAVHSASGAEIITDAPIDNQGQGRSFSPTDLAAASMATCMITIIGIQAKSIPLDVTGLKVEIEKHMTKTAPRRIEQLDIKMMMPAGIPEELRPRLIRAAEACPVKQSFRDDTLINLQWFWA
ncbi:MAG: OsmC family protein [Opitutae bacterium]